MEPSTVSRTRRTVYLGIVLIGSMASAVAVVAGLTVYVTGLTLDFIRLMDHGTSRRPGDKPRTGRSGECNSIVAPQDSNSGR